jgi:hyperosmotically inducible protein
MVLVLAILAMGSYLLGFWSPGDVTLARWRSVTPATGTANTGAVRARLDKLDEQTGRVVQNVEDFASDAALSGKIKSKMALDELVRARSIDVSTTGGVVTLTGTVQTTAERDKALTLARETAGVTRVVDRLVLQP